MTTKQTTTNPSEDDAFTTINVDGKEVPIRRLSYSALQNILKDPASYHAGVFREERERSEAMDLGIMIHHLLLQPGEEFPYMADYAPGPDTLKTNEDLLAAIDNIILDEGIKKPARSSKKDALIDFLQTHDTDAYKRVESVERAAFDKKAGDKPRASQALIDQARECAERAKPSFDALVYQRQGAEFETKLVTPARVNINGTELDVPFSVIPDCVIRPSPNTEEETEIIEVKTFQLRKDNRSHRQRILHKMHDMGIFGQLELVRILLGVPQEKVSFKALMIPTDQPESTTIVNISSSFVCEHGGARIHRALEHWLNCVRAFVSPG